MADPEKAAGVWLAVAKTAVYRGCHAVGSGSGGGEWSAAHQLFYRQYGGEKQSAAGDGGWAGGGICQSTAVGGGPALRAVITL